MSSSLDLLYLPALDVFRNVGGIDCSKTFDDTKQLVFKNPVLELSRQAMLVLSIPC